MKQVRFTAAIFGIFALGLAGCQTLSAPSWSKGWFGEAVPKIEESKYPRAVRTAVVWSPAVLNSPGKKPTRGFGGRMYFYDAQNNAVPVEGQLVVYGYNDSKPLADGKTPDRKYAFTPEQFKEHFSPTDLGASYSVWVPWDEVGGGQVDVSLVPIFTATSGQLIVGQPSRNLLPGPTTENSATKFERMTLPPSQLSQQAIASPHGIQPAAYLESSPSMSPTSQISNNLEELSIRVPSTLAERMASAGPQAAPAYLNRRPGEQAALGSQAVPQPGTAITELPRTTGAIPPPWLPKDLPRARYARPAPAAPSGPGLRPASGRLPTQPYPATQPSYPPSSLGAGPQSAGQAAW